MINTLQNISRDVVSEHPVVRAPRTNDLLIKVYWPTI